MHEGDKHEMNIDTGLKILGSAILEVRTRG